MNSSLKRRQVNTAADLTVNPAAHRPDTIFTTYGDSDGVNFTLPTPTKALVGWRYEFIALADTALTVTFPTADTGVTLNDLAADSVAVSTSSQKIGAHLLATCLYVTATTFAWHVEVITNGATATVATN
jgi:hypothetical protein